MRRYAAICGLCMECPLLTVHESIVRPNVSLESDLMLSFTNSIFTADACPLAVANDSGVRPSLSLESQPMTAASGRRYPLSPG